MAWAPDYVTIPELANYARIGDDHDDTWIAAAITSASRSVDHDCGRQFGKTDASEQRTFVVEWDGKTGLWFADIDDIQDVTGLVVTADGVTLTADQYRLLPLNAAEKGRPYEAIETDTATIPDLSGQRRIAITVDSWGWTSVPKPIEQATLFIGSEMLARRSAPYGLAGSPDFGIERTLSETNPHAAKTIRPFWTLAKARLFA